jgi:hypothetical protein
MISQVGGQDIARESRKLHDLMTERLQFFHFQIDSAEKVEQLFLLLRLRFRHSLCDLAMRDQATDASSQATGFPCPRASKNQNRPDGRRDGFPLARIEGNAEDGLRRAFFAHTLDSMVFG